MGVSQHYFQRQQILKKIHCLNSEHKDYLTNFFKYTFFTSPFGFTIYGDKPMSIETVNLAWQPELPQGANYMSCHHIFNKYKMKECWEAWVIFSKDLKLKNYTIVSYEFPLNPEMIEFAIINHQAFEKTVTENIKDFHNVLGEPLTARQILQEYKRGKGRVFSRIRNHDGLFGTLLGFGRNNAWAYMQSGGGKTMEGSSQEFPAPTTDFVFKPLFKVIPDTKETSALIKKYEAQLTLINQIYQKEDFLEQVVFKLTEN